jgi:glucokinase
MRKGKQVMFVGIEIGGTKLQLGLGAGDGVLQGLWRETVDVAAGPEGIRRQIVRGVPELLDRARCPRANVRGIGLGFGGPIDDATQTVIKSHQISGWDGFTLASWISDLLELPAALGNDADVAGLAEALFGAGKGVSPVFYVTVGSGIGGGFIIDGQIYRGCGRGAAEIGHLQMERSCAGGTVRRPLEEFTSGWGIASAARSALENGQGLDSALRTLGSNPAKLTAEDVARAAGHGDAFALSILREAWETLADGLCLVIALLCPRRIVIGGGVSLMGEELFFKPVRELVARAVFKPFAGCYKIVPAALGEEVVVHGALALARTRFSS